MLTLKQCREFIDPKNEKYSDLQIEAIRGYLTQIVQLNVELILYVKEMREFNKKVRDEEGSDNV